MSQLFVFLSDPVGIIHENVYPSSTIKSKINVLLEVLKFMLILKILCLSAIPQSTPIWTFLFC